MKRKGISKKLRFAVLSRDAFICQYCGQSPPAVILQVDHIHPVSKGGTSAMENMVTACQSCNSGKGAGLLADASQPMKQAMADAKERAAQMREYEAWLQEQRQAEEALIDQSARLWLVGNQYDITKYSASVAMRATLRRFVRKLPMTIIREAVEIQASRNSNDPWRYFCAVCWNKIKGTSPPEKEA